MMNNIATSVNAGFTKFAGEIINKRFKAGEESEESKDAKIERILDDAWRIIQPIYDADGKLIIRGDRRRDYNARGKLIKYEDNEKHLDIKV